MNPSSKCDRVLSLIESALPLLQIELENGAEAVDSERALTFIKARLDDMASMLQAKMGVQNGGQHKGSMGHIVVDTWPLNHPLGSKIIEIEYEFYRLKYPPWNG